MGREDDVILCIFILYFSSYCRPFRLYGCNGGFYRGSTSIVLHFPCSICLFTCAFYLAKNGRSDFLYLKGGNEYACLDFYLFHCGHYSWPFGFYRHYGNSSWDCENSLLYFPCPFCNFCCCSVVSKFETELTIFIICTRMRTILCTLNGVKLCKLLVFQN